MFSYSYERTAIEVIQRENATKKQKKRFLNVRQNKSKSKSKFIKFNTVQKY